MNAARRLASLTLALATAAAACTSYRTVHPAELTETAAVRVRYDSPRTVDMYAAADTGASPQPIVRIVEITGRIVGHRGDVLEIRPESLRRDDGGFVPVPAGSRVVVPMDTSAVQVRRRDAGRTAFAAVGVAAAALIVALISCGDFCS